MIVLYMIKISLKKYCINPNIFYCIIYFIDKSYNASEYYIPKNKNSSKLLLYPESICYVPDIHYNCEKKALFIPCRMFC